MKKFYLLLAVCVGFAVWSLWSSRVVDSMSVREKNVYAEEHYSWEQWCWYTLASGKVVKVRVAEFHLEGQVSRVGKLQTDLCQSLLK